MIKDALLMSLNLFNQANKDKDLAIVDETQFYKVKLSKKSGVPDMDLPPIHEQSELKKLNCLNFSIVIDESHVLVKPKSNKKMKNDNNESIFSTNNKRFIELNGSKVEPLIDKEVKKSQPKKGCLNRCGDFFKKIC